MSKLSGMEKVNVGVVGATGLVGNAMLDILFERDFPIYNLRVFASESSAGKNIDLPNGSGEVAVEDANNSDYTGLDIVLFSAGAKVSRQIAPEVVEDGAVVIDNSSAWRTDEQVPLVVADVNPEELDDLTKGIVANPNCTTMIAMPPLKALHDVAGLLRMSVVTAQAVSGAGQKGIDELSGQLSELSGYTSGVIPSVFPEPIAFNVVPSRGDYSGRDTTEELKLKYESARILGIPTLAVSATCQSVPVLNGHEMVIEADFSSPISTLEAEVTLYNSGMIEFNEFPTPLKATGLDKPIVGRVRQSALLGKTGLTFVVAGDNIRKGAALNAVQIAELLIK